MTFEIITADCREAMSLMGEATVDAIVCDPPYGLRFMGREWDHGVPGVPFWQEALRVLKPGGHLVAFGGTRTFHRLAVAIEDAGFEIRDCLSWMYGQGFPKSLDVSKAIDKAAGAERAVVGRDPNWRAKVHSAHTYDGGQSRPEHITAPATPEAEQWQGWGTALKPAWEPIVVARKPLDGTVAANVIEHGTGALNIDGTRIGMTKDVPASISKHTARTDGIYEGNQDGSWGNEVGGAGSGHDPNTGRWPANVVLAHHEGCVEDCHPGCPIRLLDLQTGTLVSGKVKPGGFKGEYTADVYGTYANNVIDPATVYGDSGGASRFFYCAKVSKKERNDGLPEGQKNDHPTCKPVAVMAWLCRLVTPPGGLVLDPFMGSGSTGVAAVSEGFRFVGVELDQHYCEIARRRLQHTMEGS